MNLQEIEKLLERYFEGDTTLSEEEKLRVYFTSGQVPERWKDLVEYFSLISSQKQIGIDDPGFDAKIMNLIVDDKQAPVLDLRRPWIYWIAGIAATVLILVAVFVKFDPFPKKIGDTYKDPQVAYAEAKKILLYVSAQFNKGTANLDKVKAYETGVNELKAVTAYNKAVSEMNRVEEVEKVSKLIMNN